MILRIYQRFFKFISDSTQYIGDFLNISMIRHGISTYRQISSNHSSIPPTNHTSNYNKKRSPTRVTFLPYSQTRICLENDPFLVIQRSVISNPASCIMSSIVSIVTTTTFLAMRRALERIEN